MHLPSHITSHIETPLFIFYLNSNSYTSYIPYHHHSSLHHSAFLIITSFT